MQRYPICPNGTYHFTIAEGLFGWDDEFQPGELKPRYASPLRTKAQAEAGWDPKEIEIPAAITPLLKLCGS